MPLIKFPDSPYNSIHVSYESPEIKIEDDFYCISNIKECKDSSEILEHNKNWALRFHLCAENDRLLRANVAECSICALAEANIEDIKTYADFGILLLVLDDFFDEKASISIQKHDLKQALNSLLTILKKGNVDPKTNCQADLFPDLKYFCAAMADIHCQLLRKHVDQNYFHMSMTEWFDFLIQEWQQRRIQNKLSINDYMNTRVVAGGMDVANELAYILLGITISPKLRNNTKFLMLKRHAYEALIIANDILSFNKEYKRDEFSINYLSLLQEENHFSLEKVIKLSITHYNDRVTKFQNISQSLLRELNIHEKQIAEKALKVMADQVQAHLEWALQTVRYRESAIQFKKIYNKP